MTQVGTEPTKHCIYLGSDELIIWGWYVLRENVSALHKLHLTAAMLWQKFNRKRNKSCLQVNINPPPNTHTHKHPPQSSTSRCLPIALWLDVWLAPPSSNTLPSLQTGIGQYDSDKPAEVLVLCRRQPPTALVTFSLHVCQRGDVGSYIRLDAADNQCVFQTFYRKLRFY